MEKVHHHRNYILSVAGTLSSIVLASLLIVSVRGTNRSLVVPVVFLVFIILFARYFGMLAGILASVICSGLFALFLYEPYGSFYIRDHRAAYNVCLLLVAGVCLSYANATGEEEQ